ncbi:ABC transporter permease [Nocardioides nematodiphilus]|uniref:ABC transporter permease n=1 Tax=Nocardioides nematodiphilus TaxID=2849669 RepID=UPI001CDA4C7A|nr:ABC transporter permease [Nocardioides nematodiphilus]MCA1983362.1 ABC transporter permease [Nocardioides nematodiphilus]
MFLALRELSFARSRFVLMGAVVALIAVLMVLLSGLSAGLVNDGVSGLKRLPVTSLAFQHDVSKDAAFTRSVVEDTAVATWAGQPHVAAAAPLGVSLANARTSRGLEIDFAIFGVEPSSFLNPRAAEGHGVTGPAQIAISPTAVDAGVRIGDTVTLEPSGTTLKVVGALADQNTFGHVDIGYVDLRTWQEIHAGVRPGDPVPDRVYHEITAVGVRAADGASVDLTAGDHAAGTTSMTLHASFGASPGYAAETATLQLIQAFLYAISALVVGAFFTVLTIQRRTEIAVLRAMGASTAYLLRDSLLQSLFLLTASSATGVALGVAAGAALESTPMPFALETTPIVGATLLLIVLGVAGASVAVVRITRVDPLTALGGSR